MDQNEPPCNSRRNLSTGLRAGRILSIVFLLGIGFVAGQFSSKEFRLIFARSDDRSIPINPGPWGELEYLPITIAAPDSLLPVRKTEATPLRWFLKGYTKDGFRVFLDYLKVPAPLRDQLLNSSDLKVRSDGIEVVPSREFINDLSPNARSAVYQVLANSFENDVFKEVLQAAEIETLFRKSGVSDKTISSLKRTSCSYGKYLICYSFPYLVADIPTYDEKIAFLKAISRQKTMLVKLRVTQGQDVNALAAYWGKACWSTDVKAILQSLAETPGGAWMDVVQLLPPLPTSLLYTYPVPQNPLNGPMVKQDCHWTSLNFFRDKPDARFNDPNYILEQLKTDFSAIRSDPAFGDVVLFLTPAGDIVHSAVYLADNIVFTKNGDNATRPWLLSTITDLLDVYSFNVPPDQKLIVSYMRNKYY